MKRILLSGATGHLGNVVTKKLITLNVPILAVGRNKEKLQKLKEDICSPLLKTASIDLTNADDINEAINKFGSVDKLIHLAAQVDANASLEDHIKDNLISTVTLIGCLRDTLDQVVNLSSIEVYGTPTTPVIKENHSTFPDSYYGAGKLASEKFLQVFGMEKNAIITNLRCASIYGPGETIRRASTVFLQNVINGKPITVAGNGSDIRDYIYVEDVADAVIASLMAKKSGFYNLGGGEPLSIEGMAKLIIEISGKDIEIEYAERTKSKYDLSLDITKIYDELEFKPKVSMKEGLTLEYQSFLQDNH